MFRDPPLKGFRSHENNEGVHTVNRHVKHACPDLITACRYKAVLQTLLYIEAVHRQTMGNYIT